jgi:CheY-like chemotaxis protein
MPKVLVVDDVVDNVELLADALEDVGYEVLKAFSGIEALNIAGSSKPDVIMLDIMMPGIDGIEVCRRLKSNPKLKSIPVIMVSALGEDSDLKMGLEAGAQDYIIKPYNVSVALSQVQIALTRGRSTAI